MSLAGKSFAILQRDILLLGTNIATSIVVARTLGPHALGLLVILNLITSYAETFGRLKVDAAAVYYLGQGKYEHADVIFVVNVIAMISGLLIILPALVWFDLFTNTLFAADAVGVKPLVYVMLAQVPINFLYMNYAYLHIQREDVRSLNIMVMTRALLASLLTVTLLFWLELGLTGVVIGQTCGIVCAMLLGIWRYGRVKRSSRSVDYALIKDLGRYGLKLYIGTVFSYMTSYSSQAIVVAMCAPPQVAYFSIAQQLGQLVSKVTDALGTFLFARVAKSTDSSQSADLCARAFRVALVVLIPGIVLASLLMKPVLFVTYGASYAPVLVPFWIIVPGLALAAAATALGMYFQGTGRADLVAKIALAPIVIQLTVGVALISKLGIVGAAMGFLCALLVTTIIQLAVFVRITGKSVRRDFFIRREDVDTVAKFAMGLFQRRHPRPM